MGHIEVALKYSYNDVSIIPAPISTLKHRTEANPFKNGMLPIFTAPMTSIVNVDNITMYEDNKIIPILPRDKKYDVNVRFDFATQGRWAAFSLDEFKNLFCYDKKSVKIEDKAHVLIDMANGHMENLFEMVKVAKTHYGDKLVVMIGNIANPETYYHATKCGADYVRLNIGGGDGCVTSTNTGINYPIASLIADTIIEKEKILFGNPHEKCPYIVADGGIRDFCDVIKALCLGADFVMIGGIFGKKLESASPCLELAMDGKTIERDGMKLMMQDNFEYKGNGRFLIEGKDVRFMKKFYGMASKFGQQDMGVEEKVEEGIAKLFVVDGTVEEWSKKMTHFLKCSMSYLNCYDVKDIFKLSRIIVVTTNAYNCINRN